MMSTSTTARLIVVSEQGHLFFELKSGSCSFGRSPDNQIVLKDNLVSRCHAVVEAHGGGYRLRDLSSHNGTFLNGARVDTEPLHSWDAARLGRTLVFFIDPYELSSQLGSSPLRTRMDGPGEGVGEREEDPTAGGTALERIHEALRANCDAHAAQELIDSLLREERRPIIEEVLRSIRRESVPVVLPFAEPFGVAATRIALDEGGGDFFEIVAQPNLLVGALGSVRAKGMGASITAALACTAVRTILEIAKAPPEILLSHARRVFERVLGPGTTVNLMLLRLTMKGELQATCCGSVSVLLSRQATGAIEVLRNAEETSPGEVLSLSASLAVGDHAILLSEGVTSAKSVTGERFSTSVVRSLIREEPVASPELLLERLTNAFARHTLQAQDADATFVVLSFQPRS